MERDFHWFPLSAISTKAHPRFTPIGSTIEGFDALSKLPRHKGARRNGRELILLLHNLKSGFDQVRTTALRAARGAGQPLPAGEGVAAGEAFRRDDDQAPAVGGEAFGEVDEMIGHRLLRESNLLGQLPR